MGSEIPRNCEGRNARLRERFRGPLRAGSSESRRPTVARRGERRGPNSLPSGAFCSAVLVGAVTWPTATRSWRMLLETPHTHVLSSSFSMDAVHGPAQHVVGVSGGRGGTAPSSCVVSANVRSSPESRRGPRGETQNWCPCMQMVLSLHVRLSGIFGLVRTVLGSSLLVRSAGWGSPLLLLWFNQSNLP